MNQTLLKKVRDLRLDGSIKLLLIDYLAMGVEGKKAEELVRTFEELGFMLEDMEAEANEILRQQIEKIIARRDATIAEILKRTEAAVEKGKKQRKTSAREKRKIMELKNKIAREDN